MEEEVRRVFGETTEQVAGIELLGPFTSVFTEGELGEGFAEV